MSEPIKPGDLVMQIHSCCPRYLGRIFKVGDVVTHLFKCGSCDTQGWGESRTMAYTKNIASAPIEWLKRIPPLDEMEGVKNDEEITA